MNTTANIFTQKVKGASDPYKLKEVTPKSIPQTIPHGVKPTVIPNITEKVNNAIQPVNKNLCKSIAYIADHGGCGHYRMLWPNWAINAKHTTAKKGKPVFSLASSATMIFEPNLYYNDMQIIRVQRQATNQQMDFLKHFLVPLAKKKNIKMVYDADDWFFDIPKFNNAHKSYTPEILNNVAEIVTNMDYMSVTSMYLREMFHKVVKVPKEKIIVIPNRLPKFLYDGYYNKEKIREKSRQQKVNRKSSDRPRILWTGSSTHFNLGTRGVGDDVEVLRQFIHNTSKKYQWVMVGVPSSALKYLGLPTNIECHNWCSILNYPHLLQEVNCDIAITSLYNCDFNKAKSNIKLLEFGALGIPSILERIEPYKHAPCSFTGYAELESQVNRLVKDSKYYYNIAAQQRNIVDKNFWLEDHLEDWCDLYQGNFKTLQEKTIKEMPKIV